MKKVLLSDGTAAVITPASADDTEQVAAAEKICFADPWQDADIAYALAGGCYDAVTARIGGTLAGYGFMLTVADEATLANIAVLPEFRKRGVGRAMALRLLGTCRERGAAVCFLEVRRSNAAARRLYASLGFDEISVRKGYYHDPTEDAVIMKKELCSE